MTFFVKSVPRLGDGLSREACEQERSKEPPALRMASYPCLLDTADLPAPKG
jgi:hypothetical protein